MIKVTIRKGPVSLELDINPTEKISEIQKAIFKSIPIPIENQILSAIVNGSIVIHIQEKLDPEKTISSYPQESTIIYLQEKSLTEEHASSLVSTIKAQRPESLYDAWIQKALKICKDCALDKFLRLKNDFSMSSIAQVKEKSFADIINYKDENQWTCLHYVCKQGHSGMLHELINSGVQINLETRDGWTPLHLVCFYGYVLCAKILLNQPTIHVNRCTEKKGTALHMACLNGHTKIVKLLMDSRASPTIEDSEGNIALQLASKSSIIEMIPRYIGLEFLNKYSNSDKNKVLSHSGELYWSSSWQIHDKLVFLVLDTQTGSLLQYNKKVNFMQGLRADLKIPICDIEDVVNVEETSIENKYFVHIRTKDETLKYYSKNIDVSSDWVCRLLNAIKYYQNAELNFRETYRASRFVSFFDFKVIEDEEDDEEDPAESISFSSFEILGAIGEGSFGKVFKVIKKTSGNIYALKAINKAELKRRQQYKYVIAECKILKSISHKYIIPLYWAFQTPNYVYMVFEYCPYGDLSKLLSEKGALPETQAKIYIAQILLALEHLHSFDIIYRDLKPQNILIDEQCHAKLADFGLARENTNKTNLAITFCGSPGYLAPEIINNSGAWKPADIYSLGICLYELLVGHLPFTDSNLIKLYKRITTNKISFPPNLSPNAKSLLISLTQKIPEKRPLIADIKSHIFFEDINWTKLSKKEIPPPYQLKETYSELDFISFDDDDYLLPKDKLLSSTLH
ncbi:hypothetical protein SteCoe_37017 [Stentor coeruleus]|uniref:Non-specific serine/threonine protein kinase n=1 Tax=Stentor coeruleus TaxID=5963 RepID=A0A1R2ANV7_9CILI|nr:hypothetical protein SteCoe_37017 [Stentor coeruleus]